MRFTLSFRNVEALLAERGIDGSYESMRRWFLKFEPMFAAGFMRRRPRPDDCWHLDKMVVRVGGRHLFDAQIQSHIDSLLETGACFGLKPKCPTARKVAQSHVKMPSDAQPDYLT